MRKMGRSLGKGQKEKSRRRIKTLLKNENLYLQCLCAPSENDTFLLAQRMEQKETLSHPETCQQLCLPLKLPCKEDLGYRHQAFSPHPKCTNYEKVLNLP